MDGDAREIPEDVKTLKTLPAEYGLSPGVFKLPHPVEEQRAA